MCVWECVRSLFTLCALCSLSLISVFVSPTYRFLTFFLCLSLFFCLYSSVFIPLSLFLCLSFSPLFLHLSSISQSLLSFSISHLFLHLSSLSPSLLSFSLLMVVLTWFNLAWISGLFWVSTNMDNFRRHRCQLVAVLRSGYDSLSATWRPVSWPPSLVGDDWDAHVTLSKIALELSFATSKS